MGKDFYKLLGVNRDASQEEIKKGYRKMAVKWHPDKHSNSSETERAAAEERFKDIARAFEVLSNPQQKAVYDQFGEEGLSGAPGNGMGGGGGGPGGFPGGFAGFPDGAGGFPPGMRVMFSNSGMPGMAGLGGMPGMPGMGGMPGVMSSSRADEIFRSFFGGGDPFAGMAGFDDDDGLPGILRGMHGMQGMHGGHRRGVSQGRRSGKRERCDTLPEGATVRLAGLDDATHNGEHGQVVGFDLGKHRYQVRTQGSTVAIKPVNIQQVVSGAEVSGTSQADLNGRVAGQAVFDRDKGRYLMEGIRRETIALKPEHVRLPPSTRVTIEGMQNRKDLNGMTGKVVAVDDERYTIQLQSGEQVRVKLGLATASLVPSL